LEIPAEHPSPAALPEPNLHSLSYAKNDDQRGDAAPQQKRGRHECCTQRAPGIEPAMAAKDNGDIPLQLGRPPTAQAAADLENHCDLKQAAAPRGSHAAGSKNLSHQEQRHGNLAANSWSNIQVSTVGMILIIQRTPIRPHAKTGIWYPK
jgi:hypothetical protein